MKFIKILVAFVIAFAILYKFMPGFAFIGAMIAGSAYGAYEYSKSDV